MIKLLNRLTMGLAPQEISPISHNRLQNWKASRQIEIRCFDKLSVLMENFAKWRISCHHRHCLSRNQRKDLNPCIRITESPKLFCLGRMLSLSLCWPPCLLLKVKANTFLSHRNLDGALSFICSSTNQA